MGDNVQKRYADINLSENELFIAVMENKRACEIVLDIILKNTTEKINLKKVSVEKVVLNDEGKRAIRLDVKADGDDNTCYDLEMQQEINDNLPKRSRFYQSLVDSPILKSGKETKYKQLPKTYIIFITIQDFIGRDLACYTFKNYCEEIKELELGDEAIKMFLNMTSKNGDSALVELLQYMKNTSLDSTELTNNSTTLTENITKKTAIDKRIIELDNIVNEVRESEEWEAVHMTILEKGKEIGKEIGSEERLFRQVISKYQKGYPVDIIAEHLEINVEKATAIVNVIKGHPEYTKEELVQMLHQKFGMAKE